MEIRIHNAKILTETEKDFTIRLKNIDQVYEGQLNCCACGCEGEYLSTKHRADIFNIGRTEYFIPANDERIQGILKTMMDSDEVGFQQSSDGYILELHTHTTDYVDHDSGKDEQEMGYRVYLRNWAFTDADKNED